MDLGGLLLADKSALERATPEILKLGEICVCAVVRLEMLYSARNSHDYTRIEDSLSVFRELSVNAETILTAVTAHRKLGQKAATASRSPISSSRLAPSNTRLPCSTSTGTTTCSLKCWPSSLYASWSKSCRGTCKLLNHSDAG